MSFVSSRKTGQLHTGKKMVVLLRCQSRFWGFSSTHQLFSGTVVLTRSIQAWSSRPRQRCSPVAAAAERFYSSHQGHEPPKQKVVVVGVPNPFIWFRCRMYYFLIRTYFDRDFSIEEFTEGAKQVSGHLGQMEHRSPTNIYWLNWR